MYHNTHIIRAITVKGRTLIAVICNDMVSINITNCIKYNELYNTITLEAILNDIKKTYVHTVFILKLKSFVIRSQLGNDYIIIRITIFMLSLPSERFSGNMTSRSGQRELVSHDYMRLDHGKT